MATASERAGDGGRGENLPVAPSSGATPAPTTASGHAAPPAAAAAVAGAAPARTTTPLLATGQVVSTPCCCGLCKWRPPLSWKCGVCEMLVWTMVAMGVLCVGYTLGRQFGWAGVHGAYACAHPLRLWIGFAGLDAVMVALAVCIPNSVALSDGFCGYRPFTTHTYRDAGLQPRLAWLTFRVQPWLLPVSIAWSVVGLVWAFAGDVDAAQCGAFTVTVAQALSVTMCVVALWLVCNLGLVCFLCAASPREPERLYYQYHYV